VRLVFGRTPLPGSIRREGAPSSTLASDQSLRTAAVADQEPMYLRGHTRAVLAVAWSPDDHRIATGSKDGTRVSRMRRRAKCV